MTTPWIYNSQPPRPRWGVRTESLKNATAHQGIRQAPLPAEVVISLAQVAGAPMTALVQTGDRVLVGQPVGRNPAGNQVHASIAGTVTAIGERLVAAAIPLHATCVTIRGDGSDALHPSCVPPPAPWRMAPADLRRLIAAGGIVGLGGALFPAAAKLDPGCAIRALLVNGAECEPWITCDEILVRERAAEIVRGAQLLLRVLAGEHCVIAVESDMPEARAALHDAITAMGDARIGLAVVTAKYPAGGERQLIELVTGAEVPSGGLPRDIGYLCHNVGTVAAVADLLLRGRPLVSRIVTVAGHGIAAPGNFEVRIGTRIADVVAAAGGYRNDPVRLLMGGPMMGFALPDDDLPVTKATNCIVAATAREISAPRPEMPCIRCGECVEVCPARLQPQELLTGARLGDADRLIELGLPDCIECGCCDYVCPSYIPMTTRFIAAKPIVRERQIVTGRAAHAMDRFEARTARLAGEAAEREQDLATQREELAPGTAAVRDLLERARRRTGDGKDN